MLVTSEYAEVLVAPVPISCRLSCFISHCVDGCTPRAVRAPDRYVVRNVRGWAYRAYRRGFPVTEHQSVQRSGSAVVILLILPVDTPLPSYSSTASVTPPDSLASSGSPALVRAIRRTTGIASFSRSTGASSSA